MELNQILQNIDKIKKENGNSLGIDSIIIEEKGKVQKYFFKPDNLHELRSISKVLIALAIGIAMDRKMKVENEFLTLDTYIYPTLAKLNLNIKQENLAKIKKWQIKHLLTYTCGYPRPMFSSGDIKEVINNKYIYIYI